MRSGSVFREQLRALQRPQLLLWALFVWLTPFYIFKPGLPQPSDMMIVLLFPAVVLAWNGRLPASYLRVARSLFVFTAWVCVVDIVWVTLLGTWSQDALFPLYYIYNAIIFVIVLILCRRYGEPFLRLTFYLLLSSVLFLFALSFVKRSGSIRMMLTFNNPNQLGYFALLVACIIALTYKRLNIRFSHALTGFVGCSYLALLSASRAAIAGIAILVILQVFTNLRLILFAMVIAVMGIAIGGPVARSLDALQQREEAPHRRGRNFFEGRGYDRIWENKQYLVLGAGEQAHSRFAETTVIGKAEIHSSLGTLLFSYGAVGVLLFAYFMWQVAKGAPIRTELILTTPLIYGGAHQGLRFTLLWILLAIFVALKFPSKSPGVPAVKAAPT